MAIGPVDTVIGAADGHCIVTLVERKSRYVLTSAKLKARTTAELNPESSNSSAESNVRSDHTPPTTCTEFHHYDHIEEVTDAMFYFADP